MAHLKMKAITMPFKEIMLDEEGNTLRDKKTGEILHKIIYRKVKHNASYFPRESYSEAEKPTC